MSQYVIPEKIDILEILKILPHRYPFVMVDKILSLELGNEIVGIKNVTINEPFFQGHFPDHPIMPGVLIIEAMAQVGGILAFLSQPEVKPGSVIYFTGIDKVRFRRPVVPGDQIVFEIEFLKIRSRVAKMAGKAVVDENLAAEAELMASFGVGQ